MTAMDRNAEIDRRTGETSVYVNLALDGSGAGERDTGVGFLDHMLDLLARHGRLDLTVQAQGDLDTGAHHTVEDVAICIGQALDRVLGDRTNVHHMSEAAFKALARALRSAAALDPQETGIPSTKGVL